MFLIIYTIGVVFNFILLWSYLKKMAAKPFNRYAIAVYLFSVFASWVIWVIILGEWVWKRLR